MPIEIKADIRRPTPDEFKALAYDVMACIFKVHNEIGRFCDEKIYKRLVAKRFGDIETEVPIIISFDTFSKSYFLDMLIHGCAIFRIKGCRTIVSRTCWTDIELPVACRSTARKAGQFTAGDCRARVREYNSQTI